MNDERPGGTPEIPSGKAAIFTAAQTPRRDRVGAVRTELSDETRRLYNGAWSRFPQFCTKHGWAALPASADAVAAFAGQSTHRRGSVVRALAAIDNRHRQLGYLPPERDGSLRAALRSARKAAPRVGKSPAPTPAQLQRLAQSCPRDLAGQRDRALLLLVAAGLGRAALVGLQAEQLRFSERGVRHGMAEAAAAPPVEVARSAAIGSCPVQALEDWLRVSATRYGPVFRKVNRWGQLEHAALGTDAVRLIVARRTAALR